MIGEWCGVVGCVPERTLYLGVLFKRVPLQKGVTSKKVVVGQKRQGDLERERSGEAPAERRMVMPAPRALVVLLLHRLRVIPAQPCLSST